MRRVLVGGLLGALPGAAITVGALALHARDVIGDPTAVGFLGLALLFVGLIVGVVVGAARTPHTGKSHVGKALIGMGIGFVVAVAVGMPLSAAFMPVWVVVEPIGMLAGAALGVRWSERRSPGTRVGG